MKTNTYSSKLVDFSLDLKYNNIPEEALKNAKFHILDLIGVTIASTRENSSKIAYNTFNKLGGNSESTVIGSKKNLMCLQLL